MFSQVSDLAAECSAFGEPLDTALARHGSDLFNQPTQFKQWTLNDILGHLHIWNWAADTTLHNPEHFQEFIALAAAAMQRGQMRQFEHQWLKGLEGETLLATWHDYAQAMCTRFANADPAERVEWAGPGMSLRSSVTARLMETWAHSQAAYDMLGIERENEDRIRNIVLLGVNTFNWTFRNRNLAPPEPQPFVSVLAPSGETWSFGTPSDTEKVSGSAVEFCQVVTQVRNVRDTQLDVHGEAAVAWMDIAQCFAGPPENPPAPGSRCVASVPPMQGQQKSVSP